MNFEAPFGYYFDPEASLPANYATIEIETKTLKGLPWISPLGLFYGKDLKVMPKGTNIAYVLGKDFNLYSESPQVRKLTSHQAVVGLDFLREDLPETLLVKMRLVGGVEGFPFGMIRDLTRALDKANVKQKLDFKRDLVNVPEYFPIPEHKHLLQDMKDGSHFSEAMTSFVEAFVNSRPLKGSGHDYQDQIDRLAGLIGQVYQRTSLPSVSLASSEKEKEDEVDLTKPVIMDLPGKLKMKISKWNALEVNSIEGNITVVMEGSVETKSFLIANHAGHKPTLRIFATANTSGDVSEVKLTVERVGTELVLSATATSAGTAKTKYHSVL
jgi:hypothetical protein